MNEFTLHDRLLSPSDGASANKEANDIVLCRIYENGENKRQRKNEKRENEGNAQGEFYSDSTLEPSNLGNEKAIISLPAHESVSNSNSVASISNFNWSFEESIPILSEEEVEFLLSCLNATTYDSNIN
ncbi:Hypothetical predicted protein [Olea europaea subsp. europaea]|uniref:Uncharacterized protein n=1 Tax=Olea europaea subsp. europaea TaxID=158383 RepID=A0A8S0TEF2_OLEEU|nr:Hypothetical predicted protein [Olea europaea subsp. europaea]